VVILLTITSASPAQSLPRVAGVEWRSFRADVELVLKGLKEREVPLSADAMRRLKALLVEKPDDVQEAIEKVQDILDPYCLVGVSINPESRVKAARGVARAELRRDQSVCFLIKVDNGAGVTHRLTIDGDQLLQTKLAAGRWLSAEVENKEPLSHTLNGRPLQYLVVRLTARESGKREATLRFDVGQGTQDLGFRAEVPILFTVRK
jgi:hypothetical protein